MKKTPKPKAAPRKKTVAKKPAATKRGPVTYEPKPLGTTGWKPFRYPPQ
jgi:hypothetical protein